MSCHDIGRGLNTVVETTIGLLENNEISKDAARKIISSCRKGVHWCDGNEDEAIDCIRRCYCGNCMERIAKGKPLYSVWEVSNDVPNRYRITNNHNLASDCLCENCFVEIMNKHCNDENAGKREIEYIKENFSNEEHYLSRG